MPITTLSKKEKMIWGLSLHSWEDIMRVSLAIVGIFGLIVGLSTWFVVQLQRAELDLSKIENEKFQRESNEKIAAAEARAYEAKAQGKQAELELIKFRKPRSELIASPEVSKKITDALSPFKGTKFDIGYALEDREQANFLWWLLPAINAAEWVHIDWVGGQVFKRNNWPGDHLMGMMAVLNVSIELHPASREKLKPAADALVDVLKSAGIAAKIDEFNNSSTNSDALHLLVGIKQ